MQPAHTKYDTLDSLTLSDGLSLKVLLSGSETNGTQAIFEDIVEPVSFVSLEVNDNEIILTAGTRNKTALLGRNKRRFIELRQILEDYYGKELRIV